MNTLVISCSLNPASRSARLACQAAEELESLGTKSEFHDLRKIPLPLCDGATAGNDANAQMMRKAVEKADVIIIAVPIYNYYGNAAAKNMIELTGKAWENKTVGFLCAAGGRSSYMSVMSIANSLMLDFRCVIVPRFVYCTKDDFAEDGTASEEVRKRVGELCKEACRLGKNTT